MLSLSHKTKQYLLVALKVLILVGTFYYIYYKLNNTTTSIRETLLESFNLDGIVLLKNVLFFGLLVVINWLFEILKWQSLVSAIEKISFSRALKESLASLTISLATPNRIGEYGAKALFYPKKERKKILLLNFIGNGFQLLATVIFGIIGLMYLVLFFELAISFVTVSLMLITAILLAIVAYLFKERELLVKGFTIAKIFAFFNALNISVKVKTGLFSIIRYAVFSYMFFMLLQFFGVNISVFDGFAAIFAMYLLASLLPAIFILDVAVKGGVAVFLFSITGVPEIPVLCTVLLMWLLNMVFPALVGSIALFTLKSKQS